MKNKEDKKYIDMAIIDEIIRLANNNIGNKYLTPTKSIKIAIKNKKIYFISLR